MENNNQYPIDIIKGIQEFVDRIDQALIARGVSRSERNTICDEVESQVYDMLERKIQSGFELNNDLLRTVLETIDQPEAYRSAAESSRDSHAGANPSSESPESNKTQANPVDRDSVLPKSLWSQIKAVFEPAKESYQRFSQKPHIDPIGIVGLASGVLGIFLSSIGVPNRLEVATACGFFLFFAGAVLSGVSYWRIRNSRGRLLGQKIAASGLLLMPTCIINVIVILCVFFTPLAFVLGFFFLLLTILYLNFRVLRWAMNRLVSNEPPLAQPTKSNQDSTVNGIVLGSVVSETNPKPAADGLAGT